MQNAKMAKIEQSLDSHHEEMMALWKELVNMESYVGEGDKVWRVAEKLKAEYKKAGFDCRLEDVGGGWGPTLIGTLGAGWPGQPIVFSGHMDTVFPTGSWGEAPFRMEGNRAFGPGVLDMKGGLVIALFVCKALEEAGYCETPIKIIYSGNEEKGHVRSSGAEVYLRESKGGRFAFNMETGLASGALCTGRKGHLGCHITITGVESHAGNDFESGRSAIEEAAHKILKLQALTDLQEGTTVNVGVIRGGTVPNAVPGKCELEVDIRVAKEEGRQRVKQAIPQIVEHCTVADVTAEYTFDGDAPIYATTPEVMEFYRFVCRTAEEYGLEKPGSKTLGGFSDAAYVAMAGVPVICSFGVKGEWNHTKREYALVDSMRERAKLIAAVILEQQRFKQ